MAEHRVAVVTGGAKGIGRAIVEHLLGAGRAVAIWDADGPRGEATAAELGPKGGVLAQRVDVTRAADIAAACAATLVRFGRIDILVNNAGIGGPVAELWQTAPDDWRHVMDVNLTGTFLCCRAVVPIMLTQGWGRIVNIASIAGKDGNPRTSAYSASKAAVIALTKSLGKELAPHGITANAVTPATVLTDLVLEQRSEEHRRIMVERSPMKRFGTVDEVAAMVCWIASEAASFSTGAVFDASGGRATY